MNTVNNNSLQDKQSFVSANSANLGDMLSGTNPPITSGMSGFMPSRTNAKNEDLARPVDNEAKGLDSMTRNQEEIDRLYQANMDKQWTLMDKWTNRSMYNQVQEVKKELFQTSAKYRLAFYKTILDTRLEYLNEKCNAGLKMIKGHYRHQVSSYLMSKMEQLAFEVRDRQFSFLDMMKSKYAYADGLTNYPSMQNRFMQSIFEEEGKYLRFLDGLLDKFQNIVDEELRKYN